jgi:diaminohydroxyphosphoribosylaminopyrimidine deaminase/5-amino-6-(5-phosphoribosylamino)uracil reductase
MRHALSLATRAYGQTSPNPLVGAVVVKGGRVISEGWHKKAGTAHAEVIALRRAGKKAKGADLYVTLEPCCHFGKTPPCTDLIIRSGIRRVYFGMRDQNPAVNGRGLKQLKKAGIKVYGPVLESECMAINRPFIKWITTGLPFVTAKVAVTLDGRIADFSGDSKWISCEKSRLYTHALRSGSDAVMVGANTYRKDRPRLNVRLPGYKGKQPLPIVVGSKGGKKANLKKLLRELGGAGFQSILVEGGGALHTEMLKLGLVDYLVVFIAPKMLGNKGLTWLGDMGNVKMSAPLKMNVVRRLILDNDVVIEGTPC